MLSLFCPRPFVAPAAAVYAQARDQHLRLRSGKWRQTFPFPRFSGFGLIEEALALVQRLVVRVLSREWIPRAVRCAARLFRERVGLCWGWEVKPEGGKKSECERAHLALAVVRQTRRRLHAN